MINVKKVKKGLGKCWKFFAAKPAYASCGIIWQCPYCGYRQSNDSSMIRRCPATGNNCVWIKVGEY